MDRNDGSYIFVSYKREEYGVVSGIIGELEARGIRCWIDQRDIPLGAIWPDVLEVRRHDAAAVLWMKSQASVTSDRVRDELNGARGSFQLIIPLEITTVETSASVWSYFVNQLQAIPFEDPNWLDRIVKSVIELDGFALTEVSTTSTEPRAAATSVHVVTSPAAPSKSADSTWKNFPIAIISHDGRTYQLDGLNGLGETVAESDDSFMTGDLGFVAVSPDASAIATRSASGAVELWTLGAEDAIAGPNLAAVLPSMASASRLLAVDRPLGQSIRVIASDGNSAHSLMQISDGTWAAMKLIDSDEPLVSGTVVRDDVLFVRAGGSTAWASNRSKRPFSLPKVRGVDAATGADGRYYVACWGSGPDGSDQVEVVVEVDGGWERTFRGPGMRAGIVRVVPDILRRSPDKMQTSIAVDGGEQSITIFALP